MRFDRVRGAGIWTGLLLAGACASTPEGPGVSPWRPDPGPELLAACRKSPVTCRQTGEALASSWKTADEAFGAARAFSAACEAGDAESCASLDRRFARPRLLSRPLAPAIPEAAFKKRIQGTWAVTCTITEAGKVVRCGRPEPPVPEIDAPFVDFLHQATYTPVTLDGRPFECEYRFQFTIRLAQG